MDRAHQPLRVVLSFEAVFNQYRHLTGEQEGSEDYLAELLPFIFYQLEDEETARDNIEAFYDDVRNEHYKHGEYAAGDVYADACYYVAREISQLLFHIRAYTYGGVFPYVFEGFLDRNTVKLLHLSAVCDYEVIDGSIVRR